MKTNNLIKAGLITIATVGTLFACGVSNEKTISVCASEIPHAQVLNGAVKEALAKDGWNLKVTVLDWSIQNDEVANKSYDANYFQHVPYLETYTGKTELFAACKVHYEPLGIYYGKAAAGTEVTAGKSFEICDDVSNGVRALQLLEAKGVISKEAEGDNFPYTVEEKFGDWSTTGKWTSSDKSITITLIAEENLVASMGDYDFACLPCNTALTGKVSASKRAAVEDDPAQVAGKANIIAARKKDYAEDAAYKAKIDALCDAMLSKTVSDYFAATYEGNMTCDSSTQIDLRK